MISCTLEEEGCRGVHASVQGQPGGLESRLPGVGRRVGVCATASGGGPLYSHDVHTCMRVHTHVCVHVSGWEGGDTAGNGQGAFCSTADVLDVPVRSICKNFELYTYDFCIFCLNLVKKFLN